MGILRNLFQAPKVIKAYSREKQITAEFLKKRFALKTSGFGRRRFQVYSRGHELFE